MAKEMKSRKYIPITQKSFCCVPACIQMILKRRRISLLPQEDIAVELGLIVPKKYKAIFPNAKTGKKPLAGWGTQVKKNTINNFFRKNKINLKEKYVKLSKIKGDVGKWIQNQLKNNADILVCFNNKILYGKNNYGHVSIISSISKNKMNLIDPEKRVPKHRKVKLNKLIKAIKGHGEKRRAGFWVINN